MERVEARRNRSTMAPGVRVAERPRVFRQHTREQDFLSRSIGGAVEQSRHNNLAPGRIQLSSTFP